jgi:hypothetical protein
VANLKYYIDERERHPELFKAGLTFEDAKEAIERLAVENAVEIREVVRTSGRRSSSYDGRVITLNVDDLNWLLVIHEFAHALHLKLFPTARRGHESKHAELVDDLARTVLARGWVTSIPAERAARALARAEADKVKAAERRQRAARAADPAVIRGVKLHKRAEQIARLEAALRRLEARRKALETRLKRARRSLGALERAHAKLSKGGES